jgi:hypothetical protein
MSTRRKNIEEEIIKWAKVSKFHLGLEGRMGVLKDTSDISRLLRWGLPKYVREMRSVYRDQQYNTMIGRIIDKYPTGITQEEFKKYCEEVFNGI